MLQWLRLGVLAHKAWLGPGMLDPSRRRTILEMQGRWILDFIRFCFRLLSFLRTTEQKIGDHRHRLH